MRLIVGLLLCALLAITACESTPEPTPRSGLDASALDGSAPDGSAPDGNAALGTMECAPVAGNCAEPCGPLGGYELDRVAECLRTVDRFACTNATGGGGGVAFFASLEGDRLAMIVEGVPLAEPYFLGWRLASEDEHALMAATPFCSP